MKDPGSARLATLQEIRGNRRAESATKVESVALWFRMSSEMLCKFPFPPVLQSKVTSAQKQTHKERRDDLVFQPSTVSFCGHSYASVLIVLRNSAQTILSTSGTRTAAAFPRRRRRKAGRLIRCCRCGKVIDRATSGGRSGTTRDLQAMFCDVERKPFTRNPSTVRISKQNVRTLQRIRPERIAVPLNL